MTFLHILRYLDRVQKVSLLALVVTMTLNFAILTIVAKMCYMDHRIFLPMDHP